MQKLSLREGLRKFVESGGGVPNRNGTNAPAGHLQTSFTK